MCHVDVCDPTRAHVCMHSHVCSCLHMHVVYLGIYRYICMEHIFIYVVATVSRIDKITSLFCRIFPVCFAKEAYNLINPTNRSHPICEYL